MSTSPKRLGWLSTSTSNSCPITDTTFSASLHGSDSRSNSRLMVSRTPSGMRGERSIQRGHTVRPQSAFTHEQVHDLNDEQRVTFGLGVDVANELGRRLNAGRARTYPWMPLPSGSFMSREFLAPRSSL